ncbi:MAG: hypothetical protein GW795_00010 [Cyanobacteria bacterium]|nr:hypothetical protein [Cyanobacteria bacterium CG_2015-16_32_12]NCQ03575.1 hypothetical protein [Cyanobacteria bacterium CG_2015-09_32_10]NCQ40302.1 hypothetical protein [Cyanobacteria bacterium CG_2015-04_32_10]NCS84618.1 hypothetical protein [Cyanobacteria bacterium CG_2015-02_32_10]
MIDDKSKTLALMEEMSQFLPFTVYPTSRLIQILIEKGYNLHQNLGFKVIELLYHNDVGGIMCCLESEIFDQEAFVISITHLIISDDNPLAQKIRAYQKIRTIRLAMENGKSGQAKRLAKKQRKKKGFASNDSKW